MDDKRFLAARDVAEIEFRKYREAGVSEGGAITAAVQAAFGAVEAGSPPQDPPEPSEAAVEAGREASGVARGQPDNLLGRRVVLAVLRAAYAVDRGAAPAPPPPSDEKMARCLSEIVRVMREKGLALDVLVSEIQDYLSIAGYDVPLRTYSDASGASAHTPDEIGWLIEGDGPNRPVWWTGRWSDKGTEFVFGPLHTAMRMPRTTTDMEPEFSPDHACALRFARREDAERAVGLLPSIYRAAVRVSEHMWMGASAPTPEGPRLPDTFVERAVQVALRMKDFPLRYSVSLTDFEASAIRRGVGSPQPPREETK